jgi:integrase
VRNLVTGLQVDANGNKEENVEMMTDKIYKEWVLDWLPDKKRFIKESTYATYCVAVTNHLIPRFGDLRIQEITEDIIQEVTLNLLQRGRLEGKGGLSIKTVKDLLVILKHSLNDARKALGYPSLSFDVRLPRAPKYSYGKILSLSEMQRLVNEITSDLNNKNAGIIVALYTGLRIGEICALQWKDIDLKCGILKINKTVQRIYLKPPFETPYTKVLLGTPKTSNSLRVVPLSSFMVSALSQIPYEDAESYLLSGTSQYIEPRTYRRYYERYLKRIDFPKINFHGLRHTFATCLIEAGADAKTVSTLLGHASVNTTLNLYTHPQINQKRKCVELMVDMVGKNLFA